MLVEVSSVREFVTTVDAAYARLDGAGGGEPLEVVLAPGTYRGVHLYLGDLTRAGVVDVTVRGADPARPPVLAGVCVGLVGGSLHLADLVFSRGEGAAPLLATTSRTGVTIDRCAFIANSSTSDTGDSLVRFQAAHGAGGQRAILRDCWFVRNGGRGRSALLSVASIAPAGFELLALEQVALLDNRFAAALAPGPTPRCELRDCLVYVPPSDPGGWVAGVPRLLMRSNPATEVALVGGTVVADAPSLSEAQVEGTRLPAADAIDAAAIAREIDGIVTRVEAGRMLDLARVGALLGGS